VIIAGAAAGALMGYVRPSLDIDFEIRLVRTSRKGKIKLEAAIKKVSGLVGIVTNYSEHIGGWSMVNYLDYRKHTLVYRKIGRIDVRVMAPEYWTIGKMARFLELDIQDMVKIIRGKKLQPQILTSIWAKAVRKRHISLFSERASQQN